MFDEQSGRNGMDRFLVLEIALGLLLFGLAIYLYWIPAARVPFVPRWWSFPVLGGIFFSIVWLDHLRRRQRSTRKLKDAVRDATDEARRSNVPSTPPQRSSQAPISSAEHERVIRPDE
ncbi:hypothetical protein BH23GEM6_BH23GEM6_12130 [soil metagenome]